MKLGKRDRGRARQALRLAIDDRECLIQAHETKLVRRRGQYIRIVGREYRNDVKRWQRDIAAYRRLLRKLLEENDGQVQRSV